MNGSAPPRWPRFLHPLDSFSMRFTVVLVALQGTLLLACGGEGVGGSTESSRDDLPDILLVSLDTLRADRLSCYGHERETSPRIDEIAESGVRFDEVHAPSSNTKPSHMSLFTGFDPLAHDVRPVKLKAVIRPALSASIPTLPELLREAGYRTASFTDRGGLPPSAGFGRGFDHQRAEWEELDKKVAAVSRYLRTVDTDRPFFLFFHTYETHAPYLPPEPFRGEYTDPDYDGEFLTRYTELAGTPMSEFWREKGRFLRTWPEMTDADVRFASDLYDEEVAWTDRQVGRLWDIFRRERGEDALFVLFSDHGEAFFEHERLGHQRNLYAELVRVPLILVGPGLPAGLIVDEPVTLTALLPTLLAHLGLPAVETQEPSFLPLLEGAEVPGAPIYSQVGNRESELHESVIVDGLRCLRTTLDGEVAVELFDWNADAGEEVDLFAERPDDVRRMVALLDGRRAEAERIRALHPPGEEETATGEEEREISALGYTGDDE